MLQKDFLLNMIKDRGFVKGIEIGTLQGDTVAYILAGEELLQMLSVEPTLLPTAKEVQAKYSTRLTIINKTSDNAIASIHGLYDFVWVDGDHATEQVRRDILNYWPLVRVGGVMGGHDYNLVHGVMPAVDDIFKNAVNLAEDGVWWVNKKNVQI